MYVITFVRLTKADRLKIKPKVLADLALGLSQAAVAKKHGISTSTVSFWKQRDQQKNKT